MLEKYLKWDYETQQEHQHSPKSFLQHRYNINIFTNVPHHTYAPDAKELTHANTIHA